MSRLWLAAAAVLAVPALAQQAPVQGPGLPPLQKQWEDRGQAPVQVPLPPSRTFAPSVAPMLPPVTTPSMGPSAALPGDPSAAVPGDPSAGPAALAPAAPAVPGPDMTPLSRSNAWLPAGTARLQALDKVNAQATALTVKVGQTASFGSLTIAVKACVVRPPDQPADAAAYLDVTDRNPDSPPFNGWLLSHEPSASMMEHPIYDIRVSGCT
jgi:hypothetical protein